jgi:hypothetical protein
MTDHEITLPPLPHRALRPGAGDDAMQDYARAAVMLDRQQRAASQGEAVAHVYDLGILARDRVLRENGPVNNAPLYLAPPQPSAEAVAWVDERAVAWLEGRPRGKITTQLEGRKTFERPMPLYAASPPAPSAEPETFCAGPATPEDMVIYQAIADNYYKTPSAEPVNLNDPAIQKRLAAQWGYVPAPSAEPVDHTAVMREALEALEERYIGALRDNAVDALRAALEGKR